MQKVCQKCECILYAYICHISGRLLDIEILFVYFWYTFGILLAYIFVFVWYTFGIQSVHFWRTFCILSVYFWHTLTVAFFWHTFRKRAKTNHSVYVIYYKKYAKKMPEVFQKHAFTLLAYLWHTFSILWVPKRSLAP